MSHEQNGLKVVVVQEIIACYLLDFVWAWDPRRSRIRCRRQRQRQICQRSTRHHQIRHWVSRNQIQHRRHLCRTTTAFVLLLALPPWPHPSPLTHVTLRPHRLGGEGGSWAGVEARRWRRCGRAMGRNMGGGGREREEGEGEKGGGSAGTRERHSADLGE
nr:unnamed protein product [Digitaria exilis]